MRNYSYIRAIIIFILSISLGIFSSYAITDFSVNLFTNILAIFNIIIYFRVFILLAIKKNKEEKILLSQFIILVLAVHSLFVMHYHTFDNKYEIALCIISELSFIIFFILNIIKLKITNKI